MIKFDKKIIINLKDILGNVNTKINKKFIKIDKKSLKSEIFYLFLINLALLIQ